jgi:hypothetical protein
MFVQEELALASKQGNTIPANWFKVGISVLYDMPSAGPVCLSEQILMQGNDFEIWA